MGEAIRPLANTILCLSVPRQERGAHLPDVIFLPRGHPQGSGPALWCRHFSPACSLEWERVELRPQAPHSPGDHGLGRCLPAPGGTPGR